MSDRLDSPRVNISSILALLLTFAAVTSYLHYRFLKLPTGIAGESLFSDRVGVVAFVACSNCSTAILLWPSPRQVYHRQRRPSARKWRSQP